MEGSPAERDALVLLLEKEQAPAADAAEERLMRMRASVCKRLQALTFEGMIYDWERSSIDLSNDEADLLLERRMLTLSASRKVTFFFSWAFFAAPGPSRRIAFALPWAHDREASSGGGESGFRRWPAEGESLRPLPLRPLS